VKNALFETQSADADAGSDDFELKLIGAELALRIT
jgi:hypothetical protein